MGGNNVTSQGQRFRRRALRRGYKVDEVDAFLDRVEATLAGGPVDAPVNAQEVHDVVFRVRFGGYDEWQVDLHLDRVERQLSEIEERGGLPGRGPDPRMAPPHPMREERMPPPPPPEHLGRPPVPAGPPPIREERMPPPMPGRAVPMGPPPGAPGYGRYDEPNFGGGSFDAFEPGRHGKADMTAEIRMGEPGMPMSGPVGAPPGAAPGDLQRIDQMRRTFQPRRFGSGYDPAQVDRLFEAIIAAMSGRGNLSISESELHPGQFNLVPGGYFEAEVDSALREVRDILRRR
jgi:DivIVA domain-containing protein